MNVKYSKTSNYYSSKEEARENLKNEVWTNVETSLEDLTDALKSGYIINGTYNGEHTFDNMSGRQFISIDVDYTDMSMDDAVKAVSVARLKPTIYYYTYSAKLNSDTPSYRYRMIYVLDSEVNPYEWQTISNAIYDSVKEITGCFLDDKCNRVTQNTFATDKEVYLTNETYSIERLLRCPVFPLYYKPTDREPISVINGASITEQDKEIVRMYQESKNNKDFIYNIIEKGWKPIKHTEIEWEEGQVAQAINQKTFCEIYHTWFLNDNGKYQPKRLFDGEQRRCNFNNWLYLLRICKPNITMGELLCNAVFLAYSYIDNSDNTFSKKYITEYCQKAMRRNLTYKGYKGERKYITNKDECERQGITPQKAVGITRHTELVNNVMGIYNLGCSVDDNLNELRKCGIKISKTTLYSILKDEGVICNRECMNDAVSSMVDINLSVRKNKAMLEEKGIKISIGKLNSIISDLKCSKFQNAI